MVTLLFWPQGSAIEDREYSMASKDTKQSIHKQIRKRGSNGMAFKNRTEVARIYLGRELVCS